MTFRRLFAPVSALLAIATPALAAGESGPAAHIAAYDDRVIAVMKENLPTAQRVARFQTIVSQNYDMPAIAALVIGPGWANTSAADRSAVIQALTRHSAISLAKNFKSYSGEKFVIDSTVQARGSDSIVKLKINSDTLYFRVHKAGSGWSIVDVISGGVSQLAVQKSDLASTAASGGAAAVAKKLQELDGKAGG